MGCMGHHRWANWMKDFNIDTFAAITLGGIVVCVLGFLTARWGRGRLSVGDDRGSEWRHAYGVAGDNDGCVVRAMRDGVIMWKWIGYGAAALVGILVTKKVIDEFSEPSFEDGYKDGRAGKPSHVSCTSDVLTPYCEGFFKGVEARKLAGGA